MRGKKHIVKALVLGVLFCSMSVPCASVSAVNLNDVGGTAVTQSAEANTNAGYNGDYANSPEGEAARIQEQWDAMDKATSITAEDLARANKLATPISKVIRTFISLIMLTLTVLLGGISALDVVCMMVSPLRKAVGGTSGGAGGGMDMGMGMGMSGGMGMGMGMSGGGSPAPAQDGIIAKIAGWASKDCEDAIRESTPQQSSGGGMGMMGIGAAPSAPPSTKNMLITYAKKRAITMTLAIVCFIMFTGNTFTDLGVKIATKLTAIILGINLG